MQSKDKYDSWLTYKISSPLDVTINKPFKDELKMRYTKYCIDQKDTKTRVIQKDQINWIGEIWYGDKLPSEIDSKS